MPRHRRTVRIAVSIGLRKRTSKKMAASREKSGRAHLATSETGEIIVKKDLEFSFTKMGTNTKECGLWTRSTAKGLTGDSTEESSEESIPEIGSKTRSMEEAPFSSKTAIDTTDTGSMGCLREKEE